MKTCLFDSFRGMVNDIPVKGIPRAIQLEHGMVERDLLYKRAVDMEEAESVLSFCKFFEAVTHGATILPTRLPLQHVAFYREVVVRLIEAGELPLKAKSQFDRTFSADFLKALANN
ncbi:MAG TPA: hypothetical protein VIK59_04310 [Verrucomicrobiae bacterium]